MNSGDIRKYLQIYKHKADVSAIRQEGAKMDDISEDIAELQREEYAAHPEDFMDDDERQTAEELYDKAWWGALGDEE